MSKKIKKTDVLNDAITYEKLQKAAADNVVLGNVSGADSDIVELTAAQLAGIVDGELLIDEDDFASDTDTKAPTQQSTKAYVDSVASQSFDLISSQTASTSASISFTGLSSSYKRYEVHLEGVVGDTDLTTLVMRTSTNGGSSYDSGASDYSYTAILAAGSSVVAQSTSTTYIPMTTNASGTASNEVMHGKVTIMNHTDAAYTHVWVDYTQINYLATFNVGHVGAYRASATDVDAIQFLFTSGNIASGRFTLYGYK